MLFENINFFFLNNYVEKKSLFFAASSGVNLAHRII